MQHDIVLPGFTQENEPVMEIEWGDQIIHEPLSAVYAAEGRRANELDGATWTRFSISIWSDIRKSAEEIALKHPAMFPAALAGRLIECFTTQGMVVLDPFVGVGSTVIAAKQLGRKGIGIELNPEFAEIAKKRLQQRDLFDSGEGTEVTIITDDARNLRRHVDAESIDLVVTSPPY